jgi:hypothetical protein
MIQTLGSKAAAWIGTSAEDNDVVASLTTELA